VFWASYGNAHVQKVARAGKPAPTIRVLGATKLGSPKVAVCRRRRLQHGMARTGDANTLHVLELLDMVDPATLHLSRPYCRRALDISTIDFAGIPTKHK
jgi:hypothetical protein